VVVICAALLALPGCGGDRPGDASRSGGRARADVNAPRATMPRFSHIVVIVLENKEYGEVIGDRHGPTFNRLARREALMTRYYGVAHPSLPNYVALVSGSTQGIADDCIHCAVDRLDLVDSLEAGHRSWKTYAEGLPRAGFTGARNGSYTKKDNPLLYFKDVTRNPSRLDRIVPLGQFGRDLAADALPDFSLVVPDLCHDLHDCRLATGHAWLKRFLARLLASPQLRRGVVFIVFDEGDKSDHSGGGGHTVALAVGPAVRPRSRDTALLTHYSLLRTIEDAWGLPRLGRSRFAQPFAGIWRRGG
jgi:hypothetical protein